MTFIASVIAKEGIAIVADSFRTTVHHSLDEDKFLEFIDKAVDKVNIPIADLVGLFEEKASHTRNFVDKLIQFDDDSAVCTAGAAYINGKETKDVIKTVAVEMQVNKGVYDAMTIEEKLTEISSKIEKEIVEQLATYNVGATDFIFSHFNRAKNEPQVFVIKIKKTDKGAFNKDKPELVSWDDRTNLGIITDGQDTFVDRLIFGSLYTNMGNVKRGIIEYIVTKFNLEGEDTDNLIKEVTHQDFIRPIITQDIFNIKFRELSLQEAVDLATLLIKIEMDIQIYTEKIPTVGGLIRLAVISKDKGFQWISGDKIINPKLL